MPAAFHGGIDDVLLTALAIAVVRWRARRGVDESSALIRLEGHGREEELVPGADLSRTVGWFTSIYPVHLDLAGLDAADVAATLKSVKEQLRAIPDKGMGYGLLRYLNPNTAAEPAGRSTGSAPVFQGPVPGQVGFNYLGRISASDIPAELAGFGWLPASDLTVDAPGDPDMPVPAVVDINALVTNEKLNAGFAYPDSLLDGAAVQELAQLWTATLTALVRYAETPGAGGHTPSDFALVRVGQRDVEKWEHDYGALVDVWPLAPLQTGMVFHALLAENAVDLYTAQVVLRLGGDVDSDRLRAAAVALLDAIRTCVRRFVADEAGTARQVIPVAVEVPWIDVDLTGSDGDARFAELVAADRVRQFDLSRPPLLRFTFARLPEGRHALVLSNHHVLLDGWSMPLLIKDLLLLYVSRADESVLTPVRSFKAFLEWAGRRDPAPAAESWQHALAGLEGPTLLPPVRADVRPLSRRGRCCSASTRRRQRVCPRSRATSGSPSTRSSRSRGASSWAVPSVATTSYSVSPCPGDRWNCPASSRWSDCSSTPSRCVCASVVAISPPTYWCGCRPNKLGCWSTITSVWPRSNRPQVSARCSTR